MYPLAFAIIINRSNSKCLIIISWTWYKSYLLNICQQARNCCIHSLVSQWIFFVGIRYQCRRIQYIFSIRIMEFQSLRLFKQIYIHIRTFNVWWKMENHFDLTFHWFYNTKSSEVVRIQSLLLWFETLFWMPMHFEFIWGFKDKFLN